LLRGGIGYGGGTDECWRQHAHTTRTADGIAIAIGSGVIAPLWSVKDSIAHEIAEKFYERIQNEPSTPFAEILADLRKLSYKAEGGEDTYAAYCFYGDPLARRAQ